MYGDTNLGDLSPIKIKLGATGSTAAGFAQSSNITKLPTFDTKSSGLTLSLGINNNFLYNCQLIEAVDKSTVSDRVIFKLGATANACFRDCYRLKTVSAGFFDPIIDGTNVNFQNHFYCAYGLHKVEAYPI